jgi:hypothetical protein
MPDLRSFQNNFGAMLASPQFADDPSLRRALAVHRNTATKAARDALEANFPVVAALVGGEAFAACASAYVEAVPPSEPRLCLYGEHFPAFIDAWVPFHPEPYVASVAVIERLVVEALFAADQPVLDAVAIAADLDPDAVLRWHPATRTMQMSGPAASIWLAHQPGAAADAFDAIIWSSEIVLVTRPSDAVEVRVVDGATRAFLAGATLTSAASNAAGKGGDVATIFATLLAAGAFATQHPPGDVS